jgi:hypothetical protein
MTIIFLSGLVTGLVSGWLILAYLIVAALNKTKKDLANF